MLWFKPGKMITWSGRCYAISFMFIDVTLATIFYYLIMLNVKIKTAHRSFTNFLSKINLNRLWLIYNFKVLWYLSFLNQLECFSFAWNFINISNLVLTLNLGDKSLPCRRRLSSYRFNALIENIPKNDSLVSPKRSWKSKRFLWHSHSLFWLCWQVQIIKIRRLHTWNL